MCDEMHCKITIDGSLVKDNEWLMIKGDNTRVVYRPDETPKIRTECDVTNVVGRPDDLSNVKCPLTLYDVCKVCRDCNFVGSIWWKGDLPRAISEVPSEKTVYMLRGVPVILWMGPPEPLSETLDRCPDYDDLMLTRDLTCNGCVDPNKRATAAMLDARSPGQVLQDAQRERGRLHQRGRRGRGTERVAFRPLWWGQGRV